MIFSVKDYGAVGDGSTDDTAAINSAITDLKTSNIGGKLYVPGGRYNVSALLPASMAASQSFVVFGDAPELSSIVATTSAGLFDVSFPKSTYAGKRASIGAEDISFQTAIGNSGPAFKCTSSDGSDSGPVKYIENVTFSGTGGGLGGYFNKAVQMIDCTFPLIRACKFQGYNSGLSTFFGTALDISSALGQPVDHLINNCHFRDVDISLNITGYVEGVYVDQSPMVGCNYGIVWNSTGSGKRPLLKVTGQHINAKKGCIKTTDVSQLIIHENLLYGMTDGTTYDWIGISVNNTVIGADRNSIIGNTIQVNGTNTHARNGMVCQNMRNSIIALNQIDNVDTGIWLQNGTNTNKVLDNTVTNFAAFSVYNQGTNNTIRPV
jgi:hypothetical protein